MISPFSIILSGFLFAAAAPLLQRFTRDRAHVILALYPLLTLLLLINEYGLVVDGPVIRESLSWVPSLGIGLSFALDGLAYFFALIITTIGLLVLLYASAYFKGDQRLPRFYLLFMSFMASMLGLVLADTLITLFVFWELTGVSSYFLIGFNNQRAAARAGALQALLVTGLGGLALLAGFIMLGNIAGSYDLPRIMESSAIIQQSPLYPAILFLLLLGAFTKSAQVPFHFWLPNAMEAPTPVSAYLHSATMVKAGIYLLARLSPALGGTELWHYALSIPGAITMLLGAFLAFGQTDLKRLLAYSTISALGTLTLLLGLYTDDAVKAALIFLFVHSLYKGALFMIAGSVDHESGTRDIRALGGLYLQMPATAAAAVLAALSMAGLPPLLGFISKELLYEAKLQAPVAAPFVTAAGVCANALIVALAAKFVLMTFFGQAHSTPKQPHEAPILMRIGPALLAGFGLIAGLLPDQLASRLIEGAVQAVRPEIAPVHFSLWHGFTDVLILSTLTVGAGIALFRWGGWLLVRGERMRVLASLGPARAYDSLLRGTLRLANALTDAIQDGTLRHYLLLALIFLCVLLGAAAAPLLRHGTLPAMSGIPFHEAATAVLIALGAVTVASSKSRFTAITALGVVGFGVSLIFLFYGAPDLALTQFSIETLSIVLFVLVLPRLPKLLDTSSLSTRIRDALLSSLLGLLVALLVLLGADAHAPSHLQEFFGEYSVPFAHGRNVVNVILVDFRSLDTIGEITVLLVSALGVYALMRSWPGERQ